MDDIIKKLRKLKGEKGKTVSPLDDFFETKEGNEEENDKYLETNTDDIDIKPFGKQTSQDTLKKDEKEITKEVKDNLPTKGIREFTFDDLEKADKTVSLEEEIKNVKSTVVIKSENTEKIKRIKLITALLDAEQYETARQEINKLENLMK